MRPIRKLALLALLALPLFAQEDRPIRYFNTDPVNPCSAITPLVNNWLLGKLWSCISATKSPNAGTWHRVDGGASTLPIILVADYPTIQDAVNAAQTAGGGIVLLPIGTVTLTAKVTLPSNVTLVGQGEASIIKLADGSWPATFTGPFLCNSGNYICMITTTSPASNIHLGNFKLDQNGANQTSIINGADILLRGCVDCSVSYVNSINIRHTGGFGFSLIDTVGVHPSTNNTWDHNTVHGYGSANSAGQPTCGGGIFVQSDGGKITNNYATNLCDAAFIANGGNDIVIQGNTYKGSGLATLLGGAITSEASNHTIINGNVCDGAANEGCISLGWVASVAGSTGGVISNNECYNAGATGCIAVLSDTGLTVSDVIITGNRISSGIFISLFSGMGSTGLSNITVTNNEINDCPGTGVLLGYGVNHVNITGNTVTGCTMGYAINSGTATADVMISGNLLFGNGGDVNDPGNISYVCANKSDSSWNGQCNHSVTPYRTGTLVNGANENISTAPTLPVLMSTNLGADIQIEIVGPTGGYSIGGFASPQAGRKIFLNNATAQVMTLNNEDASSTATNRILTPTGADVVAKVAILVYSPGQTRWIVESYQ